MNMKEELIKLNNGSGLTMNELIERESYLESPQKPDKGKLHYIGFNLLAIALVVIVALICPKCSDADDRAIGLPEGAISK